MVHCCMSLIQPSVTSKNVTHVCIGVAILAPLCDVSKRGEFPTFLYNLHTMTSVCCVCVTWFVCVHAGPAFAGNCHSD